MIISIPDLSPAVWRKSNRSGDNGGACVGVALLRGGNVALRDSKAEGRGPVLVFTASEWGVFIAGATGSEFERP